MNSSAVNLSELLTARLEQQFRAPPIESLSLDWCDEYGIEFKVLRLDLIHPLLGGNKWFKLKHNILAARELGKHTILSFGGAYSNHLRALAAAGNLFGIRTIGLVRGELVQPLNPVLEFAQNQGMDLVSIDRQTYNLKHTEQFASSLHKRFGDFHIVPEGGSNDLGIQGCSEILDLIPLQSARKNTVIAMACGTGTTLSGLILAAMKRRKNSLNFLGISVLKAKDYLQEEVAAKLIDSVLENKLRPISWQVIDRFHGGGYGKVSKDLKHFVEEWNRQTRFSIEPVYTGKLFWGLKELIKAGEIPRGAEIIAIHTGGVH